MPMVGHDAVMLGALETDPRGDMVFETTQPVLPTPPSKMPSPIYRPARCCVFSPAGVIADKLSSMPRDSVAVRRMR